MSSFIDEYESLVNRPDFKTNKKAQARAHRLRALGLVVDPTQGGLVTPPPARTTGAFGLPLATDPITDIAQRFNATASVPARPKVKSPVGVAKPPSISSLTDDLLPGGMSGGQTQRSTPAPQKVKPQPSTVVSNNKKWTGSANPMNGIPGSPIYETGRQLGLDVAYRPVKGGITKARYGGPTGPVKYFGSVEEGGRLLNNKDPRVQANTPAPQPARVVGSNGQTTPTAPVSNGKKWTGTANPLNGLPGTPIFEKGRRLGLDVVDRPVINGITAARYGSHGGTVKYFGPKEEEGRLLSYSDPRVSATMDKMSDQDPGTWATWLQAAHDSRGIEEGVENIANGVNYVIQKPFQSELEKKNKERAKHGLPPLKESKIAKGTANVVTGLVTSLPQTFAAFTAALMSPHNEEAGEAFDNFADANVNAAGLGAGGQFEKFQAKDYPGVVKQTIDKFKEDPVTAWATLAGGALMLRGGGIALTRGRVRVLLRQAGENETIARNVSPRQAQEHLDLAKAQRQQAAALNARLPKSARVSTQPRSASPHSSTKPTDQQPLKVSGIHETRSMTKPTIFVGPSGDYAGSSWLEASPAELAEMEQRQQAPAGATTRNRVPVTSLGPNHYDGTQTPDQLPGKTLGGNPQIVRIPGDPEVMGAPSNGVSRGATGEPPPNVQLKPSGPNLQPNRAMPEGAPAEAGAPSALRGAGTGRAAGDVVAPETLRNPGAQVAEGVREAGNLATLGDHTGALDALGKTLSNNLTHLLHDPEGIVRLVTQGRNGLEAIGKPAAELVYAKASEALRTLQALAARHGDLKTAGEAASSAQAIEKQGANLRSTRQESGQNPGPVNGDASSGASVENTPSLENGTPGAGASPMGDGTGAVRPGVSSPNAEGVSQGNPNVSDFLDHTWSLAEDAKATAAEETWNALKSMSSHPGEPGMAPEEMPGAALGGTRFEQSGPKGVKGSVEFQPDGRAVIEAFRGADASTVLHETFHVARRTLNDADTAILENWAGVKNRQWTPDAEEMAARAWERYLREGVAPTRPLQGVFARIKAVLSNIYHSIRGSAIDVDISPEVHDLFDRIVGKGQPEGGAVPEPRSPWYAPSGKPYEIRDAATYRAAIKKAFPLSHEDANALTTIADSMATTWSRQTGLPKSEWYGRIAYIRRSPSGKATKPAGPNRLYQSAKGVGTQTRVRGKVGPLKRQLHWDDLHHPDGSPKVAFVVFGDRMKIGDYKPLDPKALDTNNPHHINIKMHAGPEYGLDPRYYGRTTWASQGGTPASEIASRIKLHSDGLAYVGVQGKNTVIGNLEYWEIYKAETNWALNSGRPAGTNTKVLTKKALSDAIEDVASKVGIPLEPKKGLYYTLDDINVKKTTFTSRRAFLQALGGEGLPEMKIVKPSKNATPAQKANALKNVEPGLSPTEGTISNADIVPRVIDFPDAQTGDIIGAFQFDKEKVDLRTRKRSGTLVRGKKGNPLPKLVRAEDLTPPVEKHPGYQYVHEGVHLGYFRKPIPWKRAYYHFLRENPGLSEFKAYSKIYDDRPVVIINDKILRKHLWK